MPQMTFSLRGGHTPGQQRLGSRTTRMLEVDLHDLEREATQNNDGVFAPLGLSYLREGYDEQFEGLPVDVQIVRPGETSRVMRLVKERNELLCRLMARSSEWEQSLANVAGGVSQFQAVDPETGEPIEDHAMNMTFGEPRDPWRLLNEATFPFPDPMILDALYDDDADGREIQISRPYREICPWLWDDRDEMKVVQWTVDRLGWSPWPGSFDEYEYQAEKMRRKREGGKAETEGDIFGMMLEHSMPPDINDPALPPHFREIYIRAATANTQRQKEFVYAHEPRPKQASFAW